MVSRVRSRETVVMVREKISIKSIICVSLAVGRVES